MQKESKIYNIKKRNQRIISLRTLEHDLFLQKDFTNTPMIELTEINKTLHVTLDNDITKQGVDSSFTPVPFQHPPILSVSEITMGSENHQVVTA